MDLEQCLAIASVATGARGGIGAPTAPEIEALLDFTRAVAHASERRSAPLAAYAVGMAWAGAEPDERVTFLRSATAAIDAAAAERSVLA